MGAGSGLRTEGHVYERYEIRTNRRVQGVDLPSSRFLHRLSIDRYREKNTERKNYEESLQT